MSTVIDQTNKIRIIVDSGADYTDYDPALVTVLPMTVRFGSEEFLDGVTIDHRTFYNRLIEDDVLPTTSLISPAAFEDAFAAAVKEGYTVIAITISSRLSGTFQSAVIAAAQFEGAVYVVDSLQATTGEQILVRRAEQLVKQGVKAEEIVQQLLDDRENILTLGVPNTLEYLKKGGRISSTVAFVGGVLSLRPVLTVRGGEIIQLGTARGSRKSNNFLISEINKTNGVDFSKPISLGYTGLDDSLLQKYIEDSKTVWEGHEECLHISTVGAAIGTHVGPGAILVSFFIQP